MGVKMAVGAVCTASANAASGVRSKMATAASTQASAVPASTLIRINLTAKAIAVATAIPSVVAYDFATEIPAPVDRQIVVPPYDRTMKVVA